MVMVPCKCHVQIPISHPKVIIGLINIGFLCVCEVESVVTCGSHNITLSSSHTQKANVHQVDNYFGMRDGDL